MNGKNMYMSSQTGIQILDNTLVHIHHWFKKLMLTRDIRNLLNEQKLSSVAITHSPEHNKHTIIYISSFWVTFLDFYTVFCSLFLCDLMIFCSGLLRFLLLSLLYIYYRLLLCGHHEAYIKQLIFITVFKKLITT